MLEPIIITGAGGMLGFDLTREFTKRYGSKVLATTHQTLDITNYLQVFETLQRFRPQLVINAAAYTNVDGAEKDRQNAYAINVTGPKILTQWCQEFGAKLIHFSTDQVFDGIEKIPRSENDVTHPLNYYAKTKLMGETEVLKNPRSLVIRVQWLYGEKKDRFTILAEKKEFTPFDDQWGAPSSTQWITKNIIGLLDHNASGLFHLTHDDYATWSQVYQFVKEELGLSVKLIPKKTAEVDLPAKRPLFSVLSNQKAKNLLGRNLGSWKDSLKGFLKERKTCQSPNVT